MASTQLRGFLPALEGMRGFAALGVLLTHVAFQTGAASTPVLGRIWSRFDMAVAVFFALSGFLLWRGHAGAARGLEPSPSVVRYLLNRAARILPAYWVVVCAVLLFLPSAGSGLRVWLANLALVQVFVPLTLTDGMTQMWSLSVEMAFYLVLPVIAFGLFWLRGSLARWRVPVLAALALLALGWAYVPVPTPDAIHSDNWLPGYLPWFIAGMVLAELVAADVVVRVRWPFAVIAATAFLLSATDLAGPEGLTRPEPWQYAIKIFLGAVLGFSLLAPLVLGTGSHPVLQSRLALTIGRWSYGIFIWHLAVLYVVFPVFGILPFTGNFVFVLVLTVALTLPIASASYALVEEPVRRLVRDFERRHRIGGVNSGRTESPTAMTATNAGS